MPFKLPPDANGILPDRMIAAMTDAGLILPEYPFVESQIQPASLDLRLGDVAYRVRASFLPGPGATVAERAKSLARIRDTEGYMSQFVTDDGGPQILECHTPLQNVLDKYPIIGRLEQELFEQLLGTRVRRQETRNSGLYECAFYFDA